MLGHNGNMEDDMEQPTIWRPNAPFRQYNKTDEEVYRDGYLTGLNWPAKWQHVPGGPWNPSPDINDHPDWVEYCRLLAHHRREWLRGWHEGFKDAAQTDPKIRALMTKLLKNKLAA